MEIMGIHRYLGWIKTYPIIMIRRGDETSMKTSLKLLGTFILDS